MNDSHEADAIIVGAGIAGLVATYELTQAGKSVLLLDQEGEQNLGGQIGTARMERWLRPTSEADKKILA